MTEGVCSPRVLFIIERTLKFLLWQLGGNRILLSGDRSMVAELRRIYAAEGPRSFDARMIGERIFGSLLQIEHCPVDDLPAETQSASPIGGNLDGCRIGFDLGGSDRKSAAIIDGEVVFSTEVKWDPYFKSDPEYHYQGIVDSIQRAAAHLPRIDAIGGSAAGVYIDNEPRIASLFRGIGTSDFETKIRGIFRRVSDAFGGVPIRVVNDGDVTALAGHMAFGKGAVLGIAMGTSEAAGYCNDEGRLTGWLNELAFAPIDFNPKAPVDEWSGDRGCGVQYLSQQAVGRLLPHAGIEMAEGMSLAEKLSAVQEYADGGDERAFKVFSTIGTYLGYAIALYARFYSLSSVLVLGRVVSGKAGEVIISAAERVIGAEFPDLSDTITIRTPDEMTKRHGQAVAAASLPPLK